MMATISNVRISIVVPVYNVEKYLNICMESLSRQTYQDIEIICVNDASTDSSGDILSQWKKKDPRISVITHDECLTAAGARKHGVEAATGEYLLFVDPDDRLVLNACETLFAYMKKHPVDILHFSTLVEGDEDVTESRVKRMEKQLRPCVGVYTDDLVRMCFLEKAFSYQLWNKIYRTSLVKQAMDVFPEGAFPKAQDLLAFFLILSKAKTYRGIETEPLYVYSLGRGITGGDHLTRKQIEAYAKQAFVANAINQLAKDDYPEVARAIYYSLLNDSISRFSKISKQDVEFAWEQMCSYWGTDAVIGCMANSRKVDMWAECLSETSIVRPIPHDVHTVAAFYHKLSNGGAQRVVAILANLWVSMGYNVVLFTEEEPTPQDYPLSNEVIRVVLPTVTLHDIDSAIERSTTITQAIQKYHIDVLVYHAWVTHYLLWDLVTAKTAGASFVIHCHNVFSMTLLSPSLVPRFFYMPKVYALADGVLALSEADQAYWSGFNANVKEIRNPLTFSMDVKQSTLHGHRILWVGRLSWEKRPVQVVQIFNQVAAQCPEAELVMVGSGPQDVEEAVHKAVSESEYSDRIHLEGFHEDVSTYYETADVFLCTSKYEGAPMTLAEAQSYGVPVVSYEMPYLAIFASGKGTITVEQEDKVAAAQAICGLLQDRNLLQRMGHDARENIETSFDIDLRAQWEDIFLSLGNIHHEKNQDMALVFNTLMPHMQIAMKQTNQRSGSASDNFCPLPKKGPFKKLRKKAVTFTRILLIDGWKAAATAFLDLRRRSSASK